MTLPTNSPLYISSASDLWDIQFRQHRSNLQPTEAEAVGNAHKLTSLVDKLKLIQNRNAGIAQTSSDVTYINHFLNFYTNNKDSLSSSLPKDDSHKFTGETLQTALKSVDNVEDDDGVEKAMNRERLRDVNNEVFFLQGWLGTRISGGATI